MRLKRVYVSPQPKGHSGGAGLLRQTYVERGVEILSRIGGLGLDSLLLGGVGALRGRGLLRQDVPGLQKSRVSISEGEKKDWRLLVGAFGQQIAGRPEGPLGWQ